VPWYGHKKNNDGTVRVNVKETATQNIEVIEIPFHGDIIEGALIDLRPHLKINRLCENVGIDAQGFRERLTRDGVVGVRMARTPDARGVLQDTYFIDIKDITYALTKIDVNSCKNKEQVAEKIKRYKEEETANKEVSFLADDLQDA